MKIADGGGGELNSCPEKDSRTGEPFFVYMSEMVEATRIELVLPNGKSERPNHGRPQEKPNQISPLPSLLTFITLSN